MSRGVPVLDYQCEAPAEPSRARAAGLLDLLAAAIVSMILVPQPVVRQAIMGGRVTWQGIVGFVGVLLVCVLLVYWLYLSFAQVTWGRTGAMYVLGLGVDAPSKPTLKEACGWSLGWVLACAPALLGASGVADPVKGWPARLSGMTTCRTKTPGRVDPGDSVNSD